MKLRIILLSAFCRIFTRRFLGTSLIFQFLCLLRKRTRFIPYQGSTRSARMIKKIAAEGRKFGVFLVVITQRPSKIHPDALSQCNSQIVMRITNPDDQQAIAKSSERLGESFT